MMSTDYNDFMTNNHYHAFNLNQTSYGLQNVYDQMAASSVYCPPPTSIQPTMHLNNSLLSTEYGIPSSSFDRQENRD
jgi:hypothetical protein